MLYDLRQGRGPPGSAAGRDVSNSAEYGVVGGNYDEYDLEDRLYDEYGSQSPGAAIDAAELDEVRTPLRGVEQSFEQWRLHCISVYPCTTASCC